jgi:hypothetical protein
VKRLLVPAVLLLAIWQGCAYASARAGGYPYLGALLVVIGFLLAVTVVGVATTMRWGGLPSPVGSPDPGGTGPATEGSGDAGDGSLQRAPAMDVARGADAPPDPAGAAA